MNTTETCDYLIVGGGSAGCVLAARLSEDPSATVVLLESGPSHRDIPSIDDPGGWAELLGGRYDWQHTYAPNPELDGRAVPIPRGRVLGGSSSLNAMLWYRGHPGDYDCWEDSGATGWNWESMLPYFRRCEDWTGPPSPLRGSGGPLPVTTSVNPHPIAEALLAASAELGLPVLADSNGGEVLGASLANLTISGGRRMSTARAYLDPVAHRSNLTVRTGAHIDALEFEGSRCVGVTLDGSLIRADEVILSAGAISSPHLLLLAGIGDPGRLSAHGIDTRSALPGVGRNLQDHPLLMGVNFAAREPLGPVRDNGGGAILNWRSTPDQPLPDLHVFVVQGPHATDEVAARYGISQTDNVFAVSPGLMRSHSVGELTLQSADPATPPLIDPRYLSDPRDLAALVDGLDMVMDLAQTGPYRALIDRPVAPDRRLAGAERQAFVRLSCSTFFHTAGTCAMGTGSEAVVDADLRVYGIDNLRVVDASVMPTLPSCNTNAPVVALAERAADLIMGRNAA